MEKFGSGEGRVIDMHVEGKGALRGEKGIIRCPGCNKRMDYSTKEQIYHCDCGEKVDDFYHQEST